MSIQMVSISHKTAPLSVRELFAFGADEQILILKTLNKHPFILESVMIATCNRTEIYVYSEEKHHSKEIFELIQQTLFEKIKSDADISDYLRFYNDNKAIRHLFEVACGLDSMVIGEDQILGQVKTAHQQSMENHLCGTYLNTLFRYAVTAAKKVKTDTQLSKTPVSTASVAVKAAQDYVGALAGKKVMLIGCSGKIGGIVMKNLLADYHPELYVTARNVDGVHQMTDEHHHDTYTQIPYSSRYQYVNDMDVMISATASPHYTLTYDNVKKFLKDKKRRAFVDLAVPLDIEGRIGQLEDVCCINIDDISQKAYINNQKKMQATEAAKAILDDYETEFKKWMIFQQSLSVMKHVKHSVLEDCEHKGFENAMDRLFYKVREHVDEAALENFMNCLELAVCEQEG